MLEKSDMPANTVKAILVDTQSISSDIQQTMAVVSRVTQVRVSCFPFLATAAIISAYTLAHNSTWQLRWNDWSPVNCLQIRADYILRCAIIVPEVWVRGI